ncbi:ArdC-like ssDNA-binding domain-containing protein [Arthrobacter sp. SDTb3-6]|uniref:ArdC-like ssDNA-binding domain-containing protein n=1 Tax=Arthrobacter sp. SDTb3-6 TaxID=2713571 RepID=UPI00159EA9BC|nr:ArdC-like ssDNA-binding domain-containing protein [Arthrobacter sp. SDTb3-6]NVM97735.1 DUF1738 domain-containing protein [Arthrobacter sp. SDTb3-6]
MSADSLEANLPTGSVPANRHPASRPTHLAPEERVAALTQGLVELLEDAVSEPWRWQQLLDNSATLWRYSGGNAAMLMVQMQARGKEPPTLVAGYKQWERHGRYVLKGEHALWVIAPRTARTANGTADRTEPMAIAGADESQDLKRSRILGWRGQAVFDVSQTEGEPLLVPRQASGLVPTNGAGYDELWTSLVDVAGRSGFAVHTSSSQQSLASGYTNFGRHLVSVGAWLEPEERVAVLAHELGHVMLHGPDDKLGQLYGSSEEHRGLAEVEAESVAYTVLKAHGVDRAAQSSSYLAGWADTVLAAEADSIMQSAAGCKLLSRADIAKSVLGRVTSASKCILDVTGPEGSGGRLAAVRINTSVDCRQSSPVSGPSVRQSTGVTTT